MRTLLSSLLISATGLVLAPSAADLPLRGFFPQSVQAERDLEARFKAVARVQEVLHEATRAPA